MRSTVPTLLLMSLLAAGCDTGGADDIPSLEEMPPIGLVEELRIGSREDPDLGFSVIGGIQLDGDTIYVAEYTTPEFRAYAPDGRLVRRIGRRGAGPGELQSITYWGLLGDTLWCIDRTRVTYFGRDGTLLAAFSAPRLVVEDGGVRVSVMPYRLLPDGTLEGRGTGFTYPPPGWAGTNFRIPIVIFGQDGEVMDTIGYHGYPIDMSNVRLLSLRGGQAYPIDNRTMPQSTPLRAEFEGDSIHVHRPAAADAEEGILTLLRLEESGDTIVRRELRYRPQPVEAAYRDSVLAAAIASLESLVASRSELGEVVRAATTFSPFYPPVTQLVVGHDGTIWLRRQTREADVTKWLLLEADGTPRGEIVAPGGASLLWADATSVYMNERDEFDVPWLVRYRLEQ